MIIFFNSHFLPLDLLWRDYHFVLYFYVKMTVEFTKLLTNFSSLIEDWNAKMITSEKELVEKVATIAAALQAEVEKQAVPEVDEK